ncbi:MAG: hypothetical protein WAL04_13305, partial [Acidimicrobiales bacterium]
MSSSSAVADAAPKSTRQPRCGWRAPGEITTSAVAATSVSCRPDYTRTVLNGKRIITVLPAYNAGETLKRTVAELD